MFLGLELKDFRQLSFESGLSCFCQREAFEGPTRARGTGYFGRDVGGDRCAWRFFLFSSYVCPPPSARVFLRGSRHAPVFFGRRLGVTMTSYSEGMSMFCGERMVQHSSSERYRLCCCSDLICGETFFSKQVGVRRRHFCFVSGKEVMERAPLILCCLCAVKVGRTQEEKKRRQASAHLFFATRGKKSDAV